MNMTDDYTPNTIDIADKVTFNIDNKSNICKSDGLPCLNFYFKEKCPTTVKMDKNCDCNGGGLRSISLIYSNDINADKIEVFNKKRNGELLCTFYDVSNG